MDQKVRINPGDTVVVTQSPADPNMISICFLLPDTQGVDEVWDIPKDQALELASKIQAIVRAN